MATLVIGNITAVRDEAGMARYRAEVLPTVEAYGGRFAIRSRTVSVTIEEPALPTPKAPGPFRLAPW